MDADCEEVDTLKTILVVDDEAPIRELLRFNLTKDGYQVITASGGRDALNAFAESKPDLIILDLMLPGLDGLEVCKAIRKTSRVPVIMLTARDTELDQVLGLELGADDYVTKPFSPRALLARVKAVLRRSDEKNIEAAPVDVQADLTIDEDKHEVYVRGQIVPLTPKEFELLALLVKHPGRVFRRDFLLDELWGYEYVGDTRTVDVHIRRLRKKIEEDPANPKCIITVHGVGYKYEPQQR